MFAKVDGEKFTAFIIERTFPGIAPGAEEHKLGIRGSSTCPLILNDCQVPVENVLGEVGRGHIIAFNILNVGRFKLGAACVGGARACLQNAIGWAKERKAFQKTIADFGLIREKIAQMATQIYVGESMIYRTVGMMDNALGQIDKHSAGGAMEIRRAIEEYAVECSVIKVWCSEMLDFVVDETMQIYGGYGFVEEYPAERAYRDSRVNRIFEGTNEINRLIITGWLLKRAMSGQLPLAACHQEADGRSDERPLDRRRSRRPAGRRARIAGQRQEDMPVRRRRRLAEIHGQDGRPSGSDGRHRRHGHRMLRHGQRAGTRPEARHPGTSAPAAMTRIYFSGAMPRIEAAARKVLADVAEGDMLRTQMAILRRLAKHEPANVIALQEQVAARTLEAGKYAL